MHILGIQSRSLVALLLAAILPLCCCDVRLLLSGTPLVSTQGASERGDTGGCCSHGSKNEDTSPAEPDRGTPEGTCLCSKHKLAVEGERIELPRLDLDLLVPFVMAASSCDLSAVSLTSTGHSWERPVPPATALLRLHCALTI